MKKIRSELILSSSAVIVSVCALFVSISEAHLMKVQQRAILYPHLEIGPNYNGEGFSIRVKNAGSGLAVIDAFSVNHGDHYFSEWEEVVVHFMGEDHNLGWDIRRESNINQTILQPGEERRIFGISWNDESRQLVDSLFKIDYNLQYSSILDDHWEINRFYKFPQEIKKVDRSHPQFK
ncbi:MAG: hypothetical protein AAF242_08240 [Bacteroidota bacterium]